MKTRPRLNWSIIRMLGLHNCKHRFVYTLLKSCSPPNSETDGLSKLYIGSTSDLEEELGEVFASPGGLPVVDVFAGDEDGEFVVIGSFAGAEAESIAGSASTIKPSKRSGLTPWSAGHPRRAISRVRA